MNKNKSGLFKNYKKSYYFPMKNKKLIIAAVIITAMTLWSCGKNDSERLSGAGNLDKNASYALGMSIGDELLQNLTAGEITPDYDEFIKGMNDIMKGRKTRFEKSELNEILDAAFDALMAERNAGVAQEETVFLAENARNPGINITSSGLQYEVIREGTGAKPSAEDRVLVHYEGKLLDGTVFDNTYDRGEPAEFYLNQVITGWTEGLQLMSVGSSYRFYIPSALGYGPGGMMSIPPYATLIFDVELLGIIYETNE